jgi:hypothetical protein
MCAPEGKDCHIDIVWFVSRWLPSSSYITLEQYVSLLPAGASHPSCTNTRITLLQYVSALLAGESHFSYANTQINAFRLTHCSVLVLASKDTHSATSISLQGLKLCYINTLALVFRDTLFSKRAERFPSTQKQTNVQCKVIISYGMTKRAVLESEGIT